MKVLLLGLLLNLSFTLPDYSLTRIKYKHLPYKVKNSIEKMCGSELKVRCYELKEKKETLYKAEILCEEVITVAVFDKTGKLLRTE